MLSLSRRAVLLVAGMALFPGALVALVEAHMSPWLPSMYGVGADFAYDAGDPVTPIGPGVEKQDDWWFRGPEYRALKPQDGAVTDLPAGGSIEIEIACHVAWTSYGIHPTDPASELSACPDNYGAYHAGDPAGPLDDSLVSGCALAIADKDDIEKVGWDDLAVFSVNHNCVRQKVTTFEVPERMPSCTGDKCVCAWLWLANNGTANFYMTAFDCRITDVDESLARPILPVIDPVYCAPDDSTCELAVGAKRPLYAYNQPTNVVWEGNDARPGYHASWSFPIDGAQTDIFDLAAAPSTTTSEAPVVSSTTRSAATTSSHARPRTSTEAVPTVLTTSSTTRSHSDHHTVKTTTTSSASASTATTSARTTDARTSSASSSSGTSSSGSESLSTSAPSLPANDAPPRHSRSASGRESSMRQAADSAPTPSTSSRSSSSHAHAARPGLYKHHRGSKHHAVHFHGHSHPLIDVLEAVNSTLADAVEGLEVGDAAKLELHILERRAETSHGLRSGGVAASLAGASFVLSVALCALL